MIARMDHLEIVCIRERLTDVVDFLQARGLVHLEEVPLAAEGAHGFLHRVHLTEPQRARMQALEQLNGMLAEVMPLLSVRPGKEQLAERISALSSQSVEEWRRTARRWSRELRSMTRRKVNVQDNIIVLESFKETLESLEPLLGGRRVVLGKDARAFVLKGDVSRAVERLSKRCRDEIGPEVKLFQRKIGRNTVVGLLAYPEEYDEAVGFVLREEHIAPVDLPDKSLQGATLPGLLESVSANAASQRSSLEHIQSELDNLSAEAGADLRALELIAADQLEQLRVVNRFAESRLVAVIHGWVPSDASPAFMEALQEAFPNETAIARLRIERVDRHRVPTLLENHPVFKPFEVLLSLFNPPTYGTVDPSVLVGLFFVFFYGFILGDAVYGIAVIAFALWLRHHFHNNDVVRAAGMVGVYMGISSVVFGVLFGEYCGDLGHRVLGLQPLWFHRGHDTMLLLLLAIGIGAGHIVLSLLFGIREELRHKATRHAVEKAGLLIGLLGVGAGVLAYAGVAPFNTAGGVAASLVLLLACTGTLIYASGVMAPMQMLEVFSLVTNVLSYSRLMALGMASLALADVANEFARESANPLVGIPAAFALHLLNLCIGMFSPTIHSLRLNYVEALPKFYTPEGRKYQPFKKEALL